jgi:hypothetical protein
MQDPSTLVRWTSWLLQAVGKMGEVEFKRAKPDTPDVAWGLGFEFGVVSTRCRSKTRCHHGYNGTLACDSGLVGCRVWDCSEDCSFWEFEI